MGFVYLIVQIDSDGMECHKIGISKNNPEIRLKNLKTGNSNQLRIINTYESDNYRKIERWLHRKYYNSKTLADNEFFNLTNEQVLSFIDDCKEIDNTISFLKENNVFYK